MSGFLANFIVNISLSGILFLFAESIIKTKTILSIKITLLASITLLYSCFGTSFGLSVNANLLFYGTLTFAYLCTQYDTKWFLALFYSIVFITLTCACQFIAFSIFRIIDNTYLLGSGENTVFVCSVVGLGIQLGTIYIIRLITGTHKLQGFHSPTSLLLILIPACILYLLAAVFRLRHVGISVNKSDSLLILILGIISVVTDITVFYYDMRNQLLTLEYTSIGRQEQKEQDLIRYNKSLYDADKNQKILIHDIKNHLLSLKDLCSSGKNNEATEYISSLLSDSSLASPICSSDNSLINSLLDRYKKLCSECKTSFYSDIRFQAVEGLSDEDITSLFCNLLDNAIDEASKSDDGFIDIRSEHKSGTSFLMISTINSCNCNPFDDTGKTSTKKSKENYHGIGFTSIEKIVKKYNGNIETYFDGNDNTFHTIILLKVNHLER